MTIHEQDIVQLLLAYFTQYKTLYNETIHWLKYRYDLSKKRSELEATGWITTFGGKVYKKAYYPPFDNVEEEAKRVALSIGALAVHPITIKDEKIYIIFPRYEILQKSKAIKLVSLPFGIVIAILALLSNAN